MFDVDAIIRKYGHAADVLETTGLDVQVLEAIYNDHVARARGLDGDADLLSAMLRHAPSVHSTNARVKDPEHLIDKILRKKASDPRRDFSLETYRDGIDDLIGLRALHLFKSEWREIHEHVVAEWDTKEKPIAYYRAGDDPEVIRAFEESGCEPRVHPAHYRSVHYIVVVPLSKRRRVTAELQVRTLLEEAWAEVDHLVRYPSATDNLMVNVMSSLLNRATGMADEMNLYLQMLKAFMDETAVQAQKREVRFGAAQRELAEMSQRLDTALEQVALEATEKAAIKEQLAQVRHKTEEITSQQRHSALVPWQVADAVGKESRAAQLALTPGLVQNIQNIVRVANMSAEEIARLPNPGPLVQAMLIGRRLAQSEEPEE